MSSVKAFRTPRVRKRTSVRFGLTPELSHTGFSLNLSSRGIAIATQQVQAMQKHLFLELTVGTERYKAEGVVVWSQRGVLIAGVPSSMGLRLTWAEDRYFKLIADLTGQQIPTPAIIAPTELDESLPTLDTVSVQGEGGEVLETLPDFITMLLDGSVEDSPTMRELQPLRDRVERAPRFDERLAVDFGPGVLLKRHGFTLNLSETGLALAANEPIEPGEMVVFTVRGRDGSVGRGAGVVAWAYSGNAQSHHAAAIGIRLTLADGKYRRILERASLGY